MILTQFKKNKTKQNNGEKIKWRKCKFQLCELNYFANKLGFTNL